MELTRDLPITNSDVAVVTDGASNSNVATLLTNLRELGFDVSSACDLFNWRLNYERAIPALIEALSYVDDSGHRLCIVRALSVKWAKRQAVPSLLAEFWRSPPADFPSYRWTVGSALELTADKSFLKELCEIARTRKFGVGRERVVYMLWRFKDQESLDILKKSLADESVRLIALMALARRRDLTPEVRSRLESVQREGSPLEQSLASKALTARPTRST